MGSFKGQSKYLKQPITIRIEKDTVIYFKNMALETGIPYQNLINLYLRDCALMLLPFKT